MAQDQNLYSPAIEASESLAEQVQRRSTWAVALGAAGVLCASIVAPVAVYLGHQSLRRIRQHRVGLEHRGAALAGTVLGWLGSAILMISVAVRMLPLFEP